MKPPALISLCACGVPCRYHGKTHKLGRRLYKERLVAKLREDYELVPVCPEQMGGLPTPRPACFTTWTEDGPVVEQRGLKDGRRIFWTREYTQGAEWCLWVAQIFGAKKAFLLKQSPACDPENGILGRKLRENGLTVRGI
jgi:uncharacterized protein YbbK (DUF523 family)